MCICLHTHIHIVMERTRISVRGISGLRRNEGVIWIQRGK